MVNTDEGGSVFHSGSGDEQGSLMTQGRGSIPVLPVMLVPCMQLLVILSWKTSKIIVSNVVPLLRSRSKARTNAGVVVWAWDFPQLLRSQHVVHTTGKDPTWRAWGSPEFWTSGGLILGTQRQVVPGHGVEMRSWSASFKLFCFSWSP